MKYSMEGHLFTFLNVCSLIGHTFPCMYKHVLQFLFMLYCRTDV